MSKGHVVKRQKGPLPLEAQGHKQEAAALIPWLHVSASVAVAGEPGGGTGFHRVDTH